MRSKIILLMVGGALGTYLRYEIGQWFASHPWGQAFPFGTLFINTTGSFVLAVTAMIVLERLPPEQVEWFLLIGTGFCGGFTTFSTFEWETFKLIRDGSWWFALANIVGSVVAGLVGVLLGVMAVALVFPRE